MITQTNLIEGILKLQWKQHRHDELYHNDIARLPQRDKITHFVLHIQKYVGTLYSMSLNDTDKLNEKITDCGIIITSMANMFQINLGKLTDKYFLELGVGYEIGISSLPKILLASSAAEDKPVINFTESLMALTRCGGVMADVLTKHRETLGGKLRSDLTVCIESSWFAYLRMFGNVNVSSGSPSWHEQIRNRLAFVESKHLFADFLPRYTNDFREPKFTIG